MHLVRNISLAASKFCFLRMSAYSTGRKSLTSTSVKLTFFSLPLIVTNVYSNQALYALSRDSLSRWQRSPSAILARLTLRERGKGHENLFFQLTLLHSYEENHHKHIIHLTKLTSYIPFLSSPSCFRKKKHINK